MAPPDTTNWCADTHAACRKAGITDTDTHGLRRTAGAVRLASGIDIYRVSRLLGHASVTKTERAYAGLADGHLAAAMDAVDQRAELRQVHVVNTKTVSAITEARPGRSKGEP